MRNEVPEPSFSRFAFDFYAKQGVQAAALHLQDDCGADVNILFLMLYAARRGIALSESDVRSLELSCREWRGNVTQPLRQLRRHVANVPSRAEVPLLSDVYQRMKDAELASETWQHHLLERALSGLGERRDRSQSPTLAWDNLTAYRRLLPMPDAPLRALFDASEPRS
ncbi:MAG: TIGR02444 family protein [Gammaproteobacteria bacterium]